MLICVYVHACLGVCMRLRDRVVIGWVHNMLARIDIQTKWVGVRMAWNARGMGWMGTDMALQTQAYKYIQIARGGRHHLGHTRATASMPHLPAKALTSPALHRSGALDAVASARRVALVTKEEMRHGPGMR